MSLPNGSRLGPYEIVSALGAGGMGEVYKARDTRLDRTVAVKILPSADPARKARFEREARAVAALSHPHICPLYDVGQQDGTDYLVMEYLEGETLAERLQKGALPLALAIERAIEIGEALDAAHRAGVVHRDLKPANIMLGKGGLKLLDFGLAKLQPEAASGGDGGSGMATETTPLTGQGCILGTLQYMAPEQLEGKEADRRADIWAFGAILHEMVAGRRVFESSSQASLVAAIIRAEPLLFPSGLDVAGSALQRVVKTCLAKDREERWQDVRDIVRELRFIRAGGPQPSVALAAPAAKPARWIAATAALSLVVLALAVRDVHRAPPQATSLRFNVASPERTSFYDFADPVRISPDGRQFAFVTQNSEGQSQLWVQPLDSLEARPLSGTEGATYPFWSPDSRSLAFFAATKLKAIAVTGGAIRTICDAPAGLSGSWNRNDVIIFGPSPAGGVLSRVSAAGGLPKPLTTLQSSRQETLHAWPSFLPDGDRFLYLARSQRPEATGVYASSLTAAAARLVLPVDSNAVVAAGRLLFVRDGTLWTQPFDVERASVSGEPVAVAHRVWTFAGHGGAAFSVSNTGVLAYRTAAPADRQLNWFDRGGRPLGPVGEPGEYVHIALSPDDQRVALERLDAKGNGILWLHELARNLTTRFSLDPSWSWSPVWSPDGTRLVFASAPQGKAGLYQKPASGGGEEPLLVEESLLTQPYDWSADGRFILYRLQVPGTGADVWALPTSGDRRPFPILQSEFTETEARFCPNGRWLAYTSNESGTTEVYVQAFPAASGRQRISTHGGNQPIWRRDGKEIFYIAEDGTVMAAPITADSKLDVGVPQPLFRPRIQRMLGWGRYDYAATADGRRFLVNTSVGAPIVPLVTVVVKWEPPDR